MLSSLPAASANIDFVSPDKKVVIDNDQTMKDNDAIVQLNDTTANFDNNEEEDIESPEQSSISINIDPLL